MYLYAIRYTIVLRFVVKFNPIRPSIYVPTKPCNIVTRPYHNPISSTPNQITPRNSPPHTHTAPAPHTEIHPHTDSPPRRLPQTVPPAPSPSLPAPVLVVALHSH